MILKINYYRLILLFILGLPIISWGQMAPQFTQYKYSQMFINPAFAGMSEGICINGLGRQQWVGFNDSEGNNVSPQTYMISVDSPVKALRGGLGGSITQDQAAQWSDVSLQIGYSFHLETSLGTLGLGAGFNLINRSIDHSGLNPVDPDPLISSKSLSSMYFDANLGVFLMSPDRYYVGISATNLLESSTKKLTETELGVKNTRSIYLVAGYQYVLPNNPSFEIEPSILIQSDIQSTQYNLSAVVKYNNRFWGGLNYRFQESVGVMIGMNFKDFRIGYAYDIPTLPIGVSGSHEIYLGYCFKLNMDKSGTIYKNTRHL